MLAHLLEGRGVAGPRLRAHGLGPPPAHRAAASGPRLDRGDVSLWRALDSPGPCAGGRSSAACLAQLGGTLRLGAGRSRCRGSARAPRRRQCALSRSGLLWACRWADPECMPPTRSPGGRSGDAARGGPRSPRSPRQSRGSSSPTSAASLMLAQAAVTTTRSLGSNPASSARRSASAAISSSSGEASVRSATKVP